MEALEGKVDMDDGYKGRLEKLGAKQDGLV